MKLVKNDYSTESVSVIKQAIIDKETMSNLSIGELKETLYNALASLSPSDIRGFIYRCMTNREPDKAFVMADKAIDFALSMKASGKGRAGSEIIGAAVGTLSILSGSNPLLKDKIAELLRHDDSEVVIAVIENLGHTSNLDNFHKVADLLTHSDFDIARASAKYIEDCARDAAFRKRQDLYVIEDASEEFLRKALLRLESTYKQLKNSKNSFVEVSNRISILVAMMYNEILDSMDWKRLKQEEVDERIYYALEQYLHDQVGCEAEPHIEQVLLSSNVEGGIKRSSLHTLSRLGKQEPLRARVVQFLSNLIASPDGLSENLKSLATSIERALAEGREFSIVSYIPDAAGKLSSIVPRAAGAPLKRPDPTNLDEL